MRKLFETKIRYYLLILVGTAGVAFPIQCLYDPSGLVTGGFSGIAIIVKNLTAGIYDGGIPLWLTNTVLNIPVFLVAFVKLGKRFVGRTLLGTVLLSAWLYIIPPVDLAQGDLLLAAVFGGVFSGAGMGLVLRANATTGGTDMVASLIHRRVRHYNIAQIMQVLDGSIVILGFFVFGLRASLYAIVAIYVTTQVSDAILEGFKFSKAAYIITDHYEEIAKLLMEELDRGATGLKATGMYTGKERCVLYCVVSKKQIVSVKELVVRVDPQAFIIVSDVREVLGEGFLDYKEVSHG
jgi:uncharacterized membrane-anchored protein YitT (DUF2179 family)